MSDTLKLSFIEYLFVKKKDESKIILIQTNVNNYNGLLNTWL